MTRSFRLGLAALLVALSLGALALVLREGGGGRTGPGEAQRKEASRSAALAGPVTLVADGNSVRERAPADASVATGDAPPPSEAGTVAPADSGPMREVELVEAASGRRLPGAEAWVLADGADWSAFSFDGLVERGQAQRADDEGLLRFPWSAGGEVLVLARAGALAGGGRVGEPSPLAPRGRVALHPDWDLELEVTRADGSPAAEVPIRCGLLEGGGVDYGLRVTGRDGHAVLRHAGLAFALSRAEGLELRVEVPLPEPLVRRVERRSVPPEPVRFRLPAGGSVDVDVLDLEGRLVQEPCEVKLGLVWPGEPRELSPFRHASRTYLERTTETGRASFAFVALGAELELLVQREEGSAEVREYLPGPRLAGEHLTHAVVLGSQHPLLEFRVLDPAGAPLVEAPLELELLAASVNLSENETPKATTDAEGRFRLELAHVYREGDLVHLLVHAREGALAGERDLSRPFERGLVPMGNLVLHPAPRLLAGRVLDAAGVPVEGARVRFETPVSEDPRDPDSPVWYWTALGPERVTDAQGAFELRALSLARRVRASASHGTARSAPLETDAGAVGVELVLLGTGALAGRVWLDPGVPAELLEVRAFDRPASGEEGEGWLQAQSLRADGEFLLEDLLSVPHRIELAIRSQKALLSFPDVLVEAGRARRDPRLDPLDLRGRLRHCRLTLVPPEPGTPQASLVGDLSYWGPGGSETSWIWFNHSPIEVVTELPVFDGRIQVPGYRTLSLQGIDGDRELLLERAIEVRLVLPPEIPLPEPPRYLKAALVASGEDGLSMDWGGDAFGESREILCRASAAGTLEVRWIVEWRGNGGATATSLGLEPVQSLEIEDRPGQVFELRVEAEDLQEAIEAAER